MNAFVLRKSVIGWKLSNVLCVVSFDLAEVGSLGLSDGGNEFGAALNLRNPSLKSKLHKNQR